MPQCNTHRAGSDRHTDTNSTLTHCAANYVTKCEAAKDHACCCGDKLAPGPRQTRPMLVMFSQTSATIPNGNSKWHVGLCARGHLGPSLRPGLVFGSWATCHMTSCRGRKMSWALSTVASRRTQKLATRDRVVCRPRLSECDFPGSGGCDELRLAYPTGERPQWEKRIGSEAPLASCPTRVWQAVVARHERCKPHKVVRARHSANNISWATVLLTLMQSRARRGAVRGVTVHMTRDMTPPHYHRTYMMTPVLARWGTARFGVVSRNPCHVSCQVGLCCASRLASGRCAVPGRVVHCAKPCCAVRVRHTMALRVRLCVVAPSR
jgi:hypothetical protein